MIVVGLHFGHDASVAVVEDGAPRCCIHAERLTRIKHSFPLTAEHVGVALEYVGLDASDIDFCSITGSQNLALFMENTDALDFRLDPTVELNINPSHPRNFIEEICKNINAVHLDASSEMLQWLNDETSAYGSLISCDFSFSNSAQTFRMPCEELFFAPFWENCLTFDAVRFFDASPLLQGDGYTRDFCLPARVTLEGRSIPAATFSHHFAHAANVYFLSEFENAGVLSYDGSGDYFDWRRCRGGMYYYGEGDRLFPIVPHYTGAAGLYEHVSDGMFEGFQTAGKLMGLAPYGTPAFMNEDFVGTFFTPPRMTTEKLGAHWIHHMLETAVGRGYDKSAYKEARALDPLNKDFAASTQLLFEETTLGAVKAMRGMLGASGKDTPNVCLTGGGALNCPTNTRVHRESGFSNLFVAPSTDDGGLALGSALLMSHNILGLPRRAHDVRSSALACLGLDYGDGAVDAALENAAADIDVIEGDAIATAARMLNENRVIGFFDGRGENGPRALGHRSILANPCFADNHGRVNAIKGREQWRPFAPAVLEEKAGEWFSDCPLPSPFMLFTATVLSDAVPAIRHVDGSARVQTVNGADGHFRALLEAFHRLSGVPVLLNTSFNGPGEPIVETPDEALGFFLESDLDALAFNGQRLVVKKARRDLF